MAVYLYGICRFPRCPGDRHGVSPFEMNAERFDTFRVHTRVGVQSPAPHVAPAHDPFLSVGFSLATRRNQRGHPDRDRLRKNIGRRRQDRELSSRQLIMTALEPHYLSENTDPSSSALLPRI